MVGVRGHGTPGRARKKKKERGKRNGIDIVDDRHLLAVAALA